MLKHPEALYAGVSMSMTGTVNCMLTLLMNKEFAKLAIEKLDEDESVLDVSTLTDMQKSTLCEVGNIMGNSYVTALGALLGTRIDVSAPSIVVDEGSRVLKQFLDSHSAKADRFLFVNSAFNVGDRKLESFMLLSPTDDSLSAMFDKLCL